MIAVAQWSRILVVSVKVPGSNAGQFFSTFSCTFLPRGDCSIRVFRPRDLQLLFLPYNSIAISAISFKPQKVLAMMVTLYIYQFLCYSRKQFTL